VVQFCDNLSLATLPAEELDAVERQVKERELVLEIGMRGMDPPHVLRHLDLVKRFKGDFVRMVMDTPGNEPTPEEAAARLLPFADPFRAAGIRLAIENHDRFPVRVLAQLVESLGSDWVGICLDTVNSLGVPEGPETVVQTLAQYTLSLHVKDFMIRRVPSQMGFVVEGCPAGEGRLNVPWLLRQLGGSESRVNAILELWTPPADSLAETIQREAAWVETSVRNLRTWITKHRKPGSP
jgi:sugar phosphate isomerase/epimerase